MKREKGDYPLLLKPSRARRFCGCFGAAKVNPWFTTALDAAMVILALCSRPRAGGASLSVKKTALTAVIWAVCTIPAAAAALSARTNPLAALGREHLSSSGRRTIDLEPDKWTGGVIPILSYIEPAEARKRLSEGRWTVLFFQHDCRECQHEIQTLAGRGGRDVVCVEIPPYGEESCVPDNLIHVKLTDRYDWYIETPKLLPAARLK
ncbi:MAG: hypothetical protein IJH68_07835 [Thermoguttaceae bacterium]|nr:hypothetical protein [Thermoguttaceae bacterium]